MISASIPMTSLELTGIIEALANANRKLKMVAPQTSQPAAMIAARSLSTDLGRPDGMADADDTLIGELCRQPLADRRVPPLRQGARGPGPNSALHAKPRPSAA